MTFSINNCIIAIFCISLLIANLINFLKCIIGNFIKIQEKKNRN